MWIIELIIIKIIGKNIKRIVIKMYGNKNNNFLLSFNEVLIFEFIRSIILFVIFIY